MAYFSKRLPHVLARNDLALLLAPTYAAALVDLEIGLAPESMRDMLASPRGAALLDEGLRALGAHVVKDQRRG